MTSNRREIGKIGEAAAKDLLIRKGYEIVVQNFATKFGEIDIIAKVNDRLVFVEVKAKNGLAFGTPEEMFTRGKQNKVKRMATTYLKGREVSCRIDMVAVELNDLNEVTEIRHYENVT